MSRLQTEIREAIAAAGMTRREVAQHFNVTPQHVSHWLCGETSMTEAQVRRLARILKRDPETWTTLALLERYGRKHPRGRERLEQLAFGAEGEGRRDSAKQKHELKSVL